ncbi:hypothetical protein ILFOPFJJ_05804 [Ensifer psoraleae]|nr:hypothetical protein [Sinorhizobium psoraleae]
MIVVIDGTSAAAKPTAAADMLPNSWSVRPTNCDKT